MPDATHHVPTTCSSTLHGPDTAYELLRSVRSSW
jgi:hypothetical protein